MKNINHKRLSPEHKQAWVQEISQKPNHEQILVCFSERGIATQTQIEKLTALTTKQVRTVLEELTKGKLGLPALLRTDTVNLMGQRGRPQSLLLLTEDGGAVLRALRAETEVCAPLLTDQVELAHAMMETEVFTLAHQQQVKCELEAVLPFGDKQNIRADALLHLPEIGKVIFEMEQSARTGDMVRIRGKLEQYIAFFNSAQGNCVNHDIRVLFNLPANDSMTIPRWETVISDLVRQYGTLPFQIYWMPILKFMDAPILNNLDPFKKLSAQNPNGLIEPGNLPVISLSRELGMPLETKVDVYPGFLKETKFVDLDSLSLILRVISTDVQEKYGALAWPKTCRASFFDLIRTIYLVSHYRDGPVFHDAAIPVLSLALLYRYLHMHQNSGLLAMMLKSREELRRSQNRGINLYRDAFSRMCWEFLRYHGFGRSGPLEICIRIPNLGSSESEVSVEAKIADPNMVIGEDGVYMINDLEHAQSGLAWVLSSFWIYGEELGLIIKKGKEEKVGSSKMERLFPDV
jgi:hypothetical protein